MGENPEETVKEDIYHPLTENYKVLDYGENTYLAIKDSL